MGARLFRFRNAWRGAAHESIVRKGLSWSWKRKPPRRKILRQVTSLALDRLIEELRRKRVIEKAKRLRWQSRLFTVPKKEPGKDRLILDLSQLNRYIHCPKFKMLTLNQVKLLLPKGYWTVSIDCLDGYWHLPITPGKRPFLGFVYDGQAWQFRALPFGLNVGPRAFTKVVSHVIKQLSLMGVWCLPYLDDLLIIARSKEECIHHMQIALKLLQQLGFLINEKKSRLVPAQAFDWLGVHWNLTTHTAQMLMEKDQQLNSDIKTLA